MPENILVVEYEPRYTDRVRQALIGQPFTASFARDADEALRALEAQPPQLIVVSSIIPKSNPSDLIRAVRERKETAETPILLTMSGYVSQTSRQDAMRIGASDILPKPYSESEFLGKVQQMLGVGLTSSRGWSPERDPDFTPAGGLTSNEIFGDLLDGARDVPAGLRKTMNPKDDVDKMLADTLAGVLPRKKKDPATAPTVPGTTVSTPHPAPASPTPAEARQKSDSANLDKMLSDTLSGLERRSKPAAPNAAPPAASSATYQTERIPRPDFTPDRVPISQPVLATAPDAAHEDEPTDGVKFGQYVLIEKIATGGMAEVWKARMRGVEGFQKIVAIKKILPHLSDNQDFIEMFVDEAKLAAQLNHNNIIHIYDLGKIQNSYYIAMEYVDGHDLKTILRRAEERDQSVTVELALFIASKIASALDYAHRKRDFDANEMGLVHRDVSPQNILISQEGDIKLCDFGIAKAASKASHTQAGALKGKLQYMSPEQAWGRAIDKRSDIFALATVLFELLTRRKLFTGDNEISILDQVREAKVQTPSEINDEVTPEIDAIVLKALEKDPANRYQTAGEMARDLDSVLYTFRPTPTSADLAIYMHRLLHAAPVPVHEPEPVVEVPKPAPAPAPIPRPRTQPGVGRIPEPVVVEKKKAGVSPAVLGIAAVLILGIGVAAFMMLRGKSDPAATPSSPAARPAASTTPVAALDTTATIVPASTVATSTDQILDPARINEEVQRRLAAERARLEQQARAQQGVQPGPVGTRPGAPATAAAVASAQPAPAAPQPAAAPPVVAQTQPASPAPQPAAPQPAVQPAAPPPAAPQPAAVATKEGDLVDNPQTVARMVRRAAVPYPPIAKAQRVEGTVVVRALISETGQVIETRILSGVNRPVGLNEAAETTIRRSTFSPGLKDGVRVKSWTTVRLDFKL